MQPSIERRAPQSSRIPLDDVLIRLSHEDFEECFEADGVNLGLGGLSMRAAVLPDIGSRLHCQFQSPADGRRIAADCQVVWAEDNGPHVGEFGLRFTHLSTDSEESLRRMVGHLDDDVAEEPAQVRLRLDGVGSPIVADLQSASPGAMVLEQALPFLRIGTGVEESSRGRRGYLASVELRLEGDTPRLVLTVEYEGRPVVGERTVRMPPPPELLESLAEGDEPAATELALDTLPDTLPPSEGWRDPGDDAVHGLPPVTEAAHPRVVARSEARAEIAAPPPSDRLPKVIRPGDDTLHRAAEARAAVVSLVEGIGPRLEQLRLLWLSFVARALPALRAVHARSVRALRLARERTAPVVERFVVRSLRLAQRFATTLREKARGEEPRRRVQKRRTSPPPGARRLEGRDEALRDAAPANRRRNAVLTVGAIATVAFGAWMLSPSEPERAPIPAAPAPVAGTPAAAPVAAPPAPLAAAPIAAAPAAAPVAAPVEPRMPRAMAEPTYEAGPMPAPNFPSLRDGARPQAAPGTVPASSPYAVDVRDAAPAAAAPAGGATSFGDANVPEASTFPLRMSQPVARIHGERTENGFTVTIPDSLSLSRAGPIAARHPFVESAAILNQGTTSVLTVRFVDGRRPPFRVEARGTTLDVILGR